VLLQDYTGVPCVVDLAAMRAAMARLGGDPRRINPLVPADLVIATRSRSTPSLARGVRANVDGEYEPQRRALHAACAGLTRLP